ncbi:MAG: hypothetical protein SOV82_02235, partial [[Ruminococcus] gnavus]|nr:hypothetical protein [Mediterraneibacter gnavus]
RDRIRLLPALPKAWKSGKVFSFHARGNIVLDLEWKDGAFRRAVLRSEKLKYVQVWLGEKCCNLKVGKETEITSNDFS